MTTRRMRPTRTGRGLSLEQLDDWFLALEPPARVEGVSMLDGYLTAIIIGPRSIPPEEWFDDLFGKRGNIAVASGTMLEAITSIVARFNAVSEGLSAEPPRHAPIFRKTDAGLAVPHLPGDNYPERPFILIVALYAPLVHGLPGGDAVADGRLAAAAGSEPHRPRTDVADLTLLRRSVRPSDARTAPGGTRNGRVSPHGVPGHPACRTRHQGVLDARTGARSERSTLTAVRGSHRLR